MSKQITVVILNEMGDERTQLPLEEAVAKIIKEYFQRSRFAFINTKAFNFSANAPTDKNALLEDTNNLRQLLSQEGDVIVQLTGVLVGGL